MLQISPKHKIFIGINPIDFRKGIDGIIGYCKYRLQQDPLNGHIFVFRNRRLKSIKILSYDGQGFWLCTKRLSNGKFKWWPNTKEEAMSLSVIQLQNLIWNEEPTPSIDPWRAI